LSHIDLKVGDELRVRRQGSTDDWCMCRVELLSPNQKSMGLTVEDGAVQTLNNGLITGFLPVSLMRDKAVEIATMTELEIEVKR
jgi:hypothetical protein